MNFDFDAIDTIAVTTGGAADVTQQTGGIAVNMIGRRGGNKVGASARFYLTDEAFQSSNLTNTLQDDGRHRHQPDRTRPGLRREPRRPRRQEQDLAVGRLRQPGRHTATRSTTSPTARSSAASTSSSTPGPSPGTSSRPISWPAPGSATGTTPRCSKPEGDHVSGRHKMGNPVFKVQDTQRFGDNVYPLPEVHPQPHRGPHGPHGRREPAKPGRLGRRGGDLRPLLAGLLALLGLELGSTGGRRASRSWAACIRTPCSGWPTSSRPASSSRTRGPRPNRATSTISASPGTSSIP